MLYLESPICISDRQFLSTFASMVSDMGTELGVTDFVGSTGLLSSWYDRSAPELDIDEGEESELPCETAMDVSDLGLDIDMDDGNRPGSDVVLSDIDGLFCEEDIGSDADGPLHEAEGAPAASGGVDEAEIASGEEATVGAKAFD